MIPRFYDITSGKLLVDGVEVHKQSLALLRNRIGVVLQKAVLFEGTIRSNLQWGKKDATEEEMWKALEIAQAKEVVLGKPDGLDSVVEQGGRNFSGGQKQRLTIARALVRRPEILIMDDSASALDYATDAALRKAIREELKNMTLFIVSQRAASVRNADKIVVLDDGVIVGMGTHDTLIDSCEVYREIYESQYGKGDAEGNDKKGAALYPPLSVFLNCLSCSGADYGCAYPLRADSYRTGSGSDCRKRTS